MNDTMRLRKLEYFPLHAGSKFLYHHTGSEFKEVEIVEIQILSVQTTGKDTSAEAGITRTRMGKSTSDTFRIQRTPQQIRSEGGVLGFSRKEFQLPTLVGTHWDEYPDRHEIASLDAVVEVPAGKFTRCLRVNTRIAGGDGGSAIRYYAPGVGYVYEEYADENWGARVSLVSVELQKSA